MADCSGSVVSNTVNSSKENSVQNVEDPKECKTDKVMGTPILLEDFDHHEVPQSLINLFNVLKRREPSFSSNDVLAGLIYILFLESGFALDETEVYESCDFNLQRLLRLSQKLPQNWKNDRLYSFTLFLPPFQNQKSSITCYFWGPDSLILNCVVRGMEHGEYTMCLDPLLYFTACPVEYKDGTLQNLRHLSRTVKDGICYPVKQDILKSNGIVMDCFERLPPEVVLQIVDHLNIRDLMNVGRVNSYLKRIMKTPTLWKNQIDRNFRSALRPQGSPVEYKMVQGIYRKMCLKRLARGTLKNVDVSFSD